MFNNKKQKETLKIILSSGKEITVYKEMVELALEKTEKNKGELVVFKDPNEGVFLVLNMKEIAAIIK